jgi:hypothetical protein
MVGEPDEVRKTEKLTHTQFMCKEDEPQKFIAQKQIFHKPGNKPQQTSKTKNPRLSMRS